MFIQTETTPNPQTMKFLPGQDVLGSGTAFFTDKESAVRSPLAVALFRLPEVNAVFLGSDFVTVTKKETAPWDLLKTDVLTTIMEHYVAGKPVMLPADAPEAARGEADRGPETAIETEIRELIDTRVRPAVAQDGGDIVFHSYADGIVKLEMHGACSGCPSSTATLKQGIENMLKHYIPEIVSVEPV